MATLHHQETLAIQTRGQGLTELSASVADIVGRSGVTTGLAVVYVRHTSCSLMIQENADPSAARDLMAWLARIAPENDPLYTHTAEGPDDMPSHLRAVVTKTSETIPVTEGRLGLGTWQGIFLAEHRRGSHRRQLAIHITGA